MDDVPSVKTVSHQTAELYKLLVESSKPLTAQEIATRLNIWPNAVYRPANRLVKLGMIQRIEVSPLKYKANNVRSAMNWFLLAAAQNFQNEFGKEKKPTKTDFSSLSFIKDRQSLLSKTDKDAKVARKSIDFVVSGLQVPDETILAFRKAITRGALVRGIVQQKKETTKEKLEKWRDIGTEVKYMPDIGIRLFIFDSRVVYLTSYTSLSKGKAFGIRFDYAPIALQMENLFEENWQKATEV